QPPAGDLPVARRRAERAPGGADGSARPPVGLAGDPAVIAALRRRVDGTGGQQYAATPRAPVHRRPVNRPSRPAARTRLNYRTHRTTELTPTGCTVPALRPRSVDRRSVDPRSVDFRLPVSLGDQRATRLLPGDHAAVALDHLEADVGEVPGHLDGAAALPADHVG